MKKYKTVHRNFVMTFIIQIVTFSGTYCRNGGHIQVDFVLLPNSAGSAGFPTIMKRTRHYDDNGYLRSLTKDVVPQSNVPPKVKRDKVFECRQIGPNIMDCDANGKHEKVRILHEKRTKSNRKHHQRASTCTKQRQCRTCSKSLCQTSVTKNKEISKKKIVKNKATTQYGFKVPHTQTNTMQSYADDNSSAISNANRSAFGVNKTTFISYNLTRQGATPPMNVSSNNTLALSNFTLARHNGSPSQLPGKAIPISVNHVTSSWKPLFATNSTVSPVDSFSSKSQMTEIARQSIGLTVSQKTSSNLTDINTKTSFSTPVPTLNQPFQTHISADAGTKASQSTPSDAMLDNVLQEVARMPQELRKQLVRQLQSMDFSSTVKNRDTSSENDVNNLQYKTQSYLNSQTQPCASEKLQPYSSPFDLANIIGILRIPQKAMCAHSASTKKKKNTKKSKKMSKKHKKKGSKHIEKLHQMLTKKRLLYLLNVGNKKQMSANSSNDSSVNEAFVESGEPLNNDELERIREALSKKRKLYIKHHPRNMNNQPFISGEVSAIPWVPIIDPNSPPSRQPETGAFSSQPSANLDEDIAATHSRLSGKNTASKSTPTLTKFPEAVQFLADTAVEVFPNSGQSHASTKSRVSQASMNITPSSLFGSLSLLLSANKSASSPSVDINKVLISAHTNPNALKPSQHVPSPTRHSMYKWYDDDLLAEIFDTKDASRLELSSQDSFKNMRNTSEVGSDLFQSTPSYSGYMTATTVTTMIAPTTLAYPALLGQVHSLSQKELISIPLQISTSAAWVSEGFSKEISSTKRLIGEVMPMTSSMNMTGNNVSSRNVNQNYGRNFQVDIVIGRAFEENLADNHNSETINMKKFLLELMAKVYSNHSSFLSAKVKSLMPYERSQKIKASVDLYFSERSYHHLDVLGKKLFEGSLKVNGSSVLPQFNATRLHDYVTYQKWCNPPCRQPYKCYPDCQANCCDQSKAYSQSNSNAQQNRPIVNVIVPMENPSWLSMLQNVPYAIYSYLMPAAKTAPTSQWSVPVINSNVGQQSCGSTCSLQCYPSCSYECCAEVG